MSDCSESFLNSFFVARQPIFNGDKSIWGYELLFRNSAENCCAEITDADAATSQVIADGFGLIQDDIEDGQKLLVNFTRNMLLEDFSDLLPAEVCVIEVLEDVEPDDDVLAALKRLKKKGFTLALDDYMGQPGAEKIIEIVDVVKVECLGLAKENLVRLVESLSNYEVELLAEKVEDHEMFYFCRELGFVHFQGFFFSRPEIIPGKKISTTNMNRLQLLKTVSGEDFDVDDLTRTINSDVSITYRLLRFMNSPTFGLPNKINSIQQAIVLMGYKKLAGWLRVILLSDMCSGPAGSELAFLSIKRAKFFELLSYEEGCVSLTADCMFLLGLFSLLDVLIGRPMTELLKELPIGGELVAALTDKNNQAALWINLVEAFEEADWDRLSELIDANNLSAMSIARNHLTAMQWANEILFMSNEKLS